MINNYAHTNTNPLVFKRLVDYLHMKVFFLTWLGEFQAVSPILTITESEIEKGVVSHVKSSPNEDTATDKGPAFPWAYIVGVASQSSSWDEQFPSNGSSIFLHHCIRVIFFLVKYIVSVYA